MHLNAHEQKADLREITFLQFEERYQLAGMNGIAEKYGCGEQEAAALFGRVLEALKRQFSEENPWEETELWKVFYNIADREMHFSTTSMNKNFGLTEASFNQLVSELEFGRESLFEQVFLTHFEDCVKYLMKTYGASSEDAYDASMNTMVEFCKRLKAGRISYGNLRFLFTRMAGQVYLKWIKKQQKQISLDNLEIGDVPEEIDEEAYLFLSKAWDGLLDDCRKLLEEFYYNGTTLEDISVAMNRSAVAIRKQKQRCVEKLRSLYIQISLPRG